MAPITTTTTGTDGVLALLQSGVVNKVGDTSAAMSSAGVIPTDDMRVEIPVVTADATTEWFTQGNTITESAPALKTISVTPSVVAGLTGVSNTALHAQSADLLSISMNSLSRDIDRKVDEAFLSDVASPAPTGLTGITPTTVEPTTFDSLDVFVEGATAARLNGSNLTAWIVHPNDLERVLLLKDSTTSSRPLVEPDVTQTSLAGTGLPSADSGIRLFGVPVYVTVKATEGTIWGIDQTQVFVVRSATPRLEASSEAGFASDLTYVRAVFNVGFAVANEAGVIKVTLPAEA